MDLRPVFYQLAPAVDKYFLHVLLSGLIRVGRGRAVPATTKKQRGRPRKPNSEKRRNNVTIRMKDDLKRHLEEAAASKGRSLSEEIEFSLERRFLEEAAYGGEELYGLLLLMVGAAKIIQARTEKSWSSDWKTSIAVRAAWKKLAAATGPRPPAELIQHFERGDELPPPPELPTRPSPPTRGLLSGLVAHGSVDAKAYGAEFMATIATIEKANRKYARLSAKYERQLEALRQENQAWRDHFISYQDLGEDVAAALLPRREAVTETGNPS